MFGIGIGKEKKFGTRRRWLNPKGHSDTGMISWEVIADSAHVDAGFSMWDCSRKISLDFSIWEPKDAEQRAEKLDFLIEELTAMREAMADAYKYHVVEAAKESDDE